MFANIYLKIFLSCDHHLVEEIFLCCIFSTIFFLFCFTSPIDISPLFDILVRVFRLSWKPQLLYKFQNQDDDKKG